MAVTISAVNTKGDVGASVILGSTLCQKVLSVTLDSSYPTHGYSITPKMVGMDAIFNIDAASAAAPAGTQAVLLVWDNTNQKLQAFWAKTAGTSSLQEVDNGTDLHTFVDQIVVTGRGY